MAIPVGVYARISDDTEGDAKGVGRQKDDGLGLARLRRWDASLYEDNDLSAYQRHVIRPRFEQMLEDLASGAIRGIVVYNLDRLARQPKDLERIIDLYDDNPTLVFATLEGDINLSTSDGRTMARVMVAFANKASADTGRRVKRKQLELALDGKFHGGRMPYGWQADGVTPDPVAKKEILKAHERLLAGDSLRAVQDDWTARDIGPAGRGRARKADKAIHHTTLRRLLTNPALAGVKIYNGEIVTGDGGDAVSTAWDPICTQAQIDAVTAELDRRWSGGPGTNAHTYLLSGIAVCGVCSTPMRGQRRRRSSGDQYEVYMCNNARSVGGCGKVSRQAAPVEKLVISLILQDQEAKRRTQVKPGASRWEGGDELALAVAEISELHAAKEASEISVSSLIRALRPLERRRDELQLLKRRLEADSVKRELLSSGLEDQFDAQPLSRQRALIRESLLAVVVKPNGKGPKGFNPDLIDPVWAP